MASDSKEYQLQTKTTDAGPLFQLVKWRTMPGSWFHQDGSDAGIAAEKDFQGRFTFRAH